MPKKRAADESSNDEQIADGSDPMSQQQSDAKRAKLASMSDTTLEDLPNETLERILIKVVAMEVKDMRLAKSVWKRKADLVINRLCSVCSQWSNICATKYFRNEVHRTLDDTAQNTIRLEIIHQYPIQFDVFDITAVKDEIFLLCKPNDEDYVINVLDCNNMADVKDVISLPGTTPKTIAGCSVSNCVYVHNAELDQSKTDSILRIKKADEHQFTLSPWMVTDQKLSLLTVSANGNLITISKERMLNPGVLSIYAANGSLQHKIVLCPDIYEFRVVENVFQRSNENLVLVTRAISLDKAQLVEIDTSGNVLRRYQSSLGPEFRVSFADIYGRILIRNWQNRFELLDSEFNVLDVSCVQSSETRVFIPLFLYFNSERNEIISNDNYLNCSAKGLTIFRLI